jgi:hypothetical protein
MALALLKAWPRHRSKCLPGRHWWPWACGVDPVRRTGVPAIGGEPSDVNGRVSHPLAPLTGIPLRLSTGGVWRVPVRIVVNGRLAKAGLFLGFVGEAAHGRWGLGSGASSPARPAGHALTR